ncbi:mitochondrial fission ELM1 family protein [Limobrevibacterium gyesilva]|uniref:Mitochondrial fission ELM1 family protein n=1 Tax=Limobrevibacterium gyesilva TaxID=2991712 RepID=A0AA41YLF6_9PROT|nr:mitochondrial fission ELM1 family protein [Limobrevibacterium gyesilva]MCW3474427.1 mitochondrial fission ELM1 family protein [Limobrevibacterium gyesilva]
MTEAGQTSRAEADSAASPQQVWVLDDPRAGTAAQAIGIAERLGVPFRRLPLAWNWMAHVAGLARTGSLIGLSPAARRSVGEGTSGVALPVQGPQLVISAGRRSAAVALWLKARYGCRIVHCMSPGLGGLLRAETFDLLVIPAHDRPPAMPNVLPVLGAPHRVSPLLLQQAATSWRERLAHLPHPRIALLMGGPARGTAMPPVLAHDLGRHVARLAAGAGGSVLATTSRRTGHEATEALGAGLASVMHLLYRWGEPGENPYFGFLASADAIVATADSVSMISEACATQVPVFVALPQLADRRKSRFLASLLDAGQARTLAEDLSPWPRSPLDEAGRVAAEILQRFAIDRTAPALD